MNVRRIPLSKADAETLATLLLDGLTYEEAVLYLPKLIESDSLMHNVHEANDRAPKSGANFAPIVINYISRTFFTSETATPLVPSDVLDTLKKVALQRVMETQPIWHGIVRIKSPAEAAATFSVKVPISSTEADRWAIGRDHQGLDYIARSPDGIYYRLSSFDGTCTRIAERFAAIYEPLFSAHSSS